MLTKCKIALGEMKKQVGWPVNSQKVLLILHFTFLACF